MWKEHAVETAKVLNQIDPDFIRVRTFKALRVMPIYRKIEAGELELLNDDEIIAEERLLIENLNGITSHFVSDHILNLLEELDGKFPEAKEKMLAVIDRYLALSREDRNNFRLGEERDITGLWTIWKSRPVRTRESNRSTNRARKPRRF